MSSDLVLFIMQVEDEFLIQIPNDVSDAIRTVGNLHAAIVKALHTPFGFGGVGVTPTPVDEVWPRLIDVIGRKVGGVDIAKLSPSSDLESLLAQKGT